MDLHKKLEKLRESSAAMYIVPFVLLILPLVKTLFTGLGKVNGYYLIHYLYTYDRGFVPRGLVGEVISWFCDTVSDRTTGIVTFLFAVLLAVTATLCIGKALNKVKNDSVRFKWVLGLIIILCILPFSFRMYYQDEKLDKILWMLTLLAVFAADSKVGIWFAPVLCVLAALVNPVFLFCSMILISIILLQKFYESRYSFKNGFICGMAYIPMIFIGIYGVISEKKLGFKDPYELVSFYFSRYEGGFPKDFDKFETEWLFDYFEPLKKSFQLAYEIYFKDWGNGKTTILSTVFIAVPVISLLTYIWVKAIKAEENKFQKFIFFLCAVSPVVLIPPIAISWETSKYFGNNFLVQLCLIVYFCVHKNAAVLGTLNKIKDWCSEHLIISSVLVMYLAMFLI